MPLCMPNASTRLNLFVGLQRATGAAHELTLRFKWPLWPNVFGGHVTARNTKGNVKLSCASTGHWLIPVPCPLDINYNVGIGTGGEDFEIDDISVPRGRKFEALEHVDGWFSHAAHDIGDESDRLAAHIAQLPRSTHWKTAFKEVVAAVHKASKHVLYVGRTGASVPHLLRRFADHQQRRDASCIFPVIRVPTHILREEQWERNSIRWVLLRAQQGRLCCNNDVADQRGSWPETDDCLIYIVACGRTPQ
jgi:hypothetical protein